MQLGKEWALYGTYLTLLHPGKEPGVALGLRLKCPLSVVWQKGNNLWASSAAVWLGGVLMEGFVRKGQVSVV